MRDHSTFEFVLPDPAASQRFGAALAQHLKAKDTILLDGDVGAGKTHFARSVIQQRMRQAGQPIEDVPSPTFTLVQVYDVDGTEIWHTDLYRLGHPDEVLELGLDEAFETAIVLVEWSDRLQRDAPEQSLTLRFSPTAADGRAVSATGPQRLMDLVKQALDASRD